MTGTCGHCGDDPGPRPVVDMETGELHCDIACALADSTGRDKAEFQAGDVPYPHPDDLESVDDA